MLKKKLRGKSKFLRKMNELMHAIRIQHLHIANFSDWNR